jgi:hypothetical protein
MDDPVKSLKTPYPVIPVETGIQFFQIVSYSLDSCLRGNDAFLRTKLVTADPVLGLLAYVLL